MSNSSQEDQQIARDWQLLQVLREKISEEEMIEKIIESLNGGANINAVNNRGKTILDIAIKKNYKTITAFLRRETRKVESGSDEKKSEITTNMKEPEISDQVFEMSQQKIKCDDSPNEYINEEVIKSDTSTTKQILLNDLKITRKGMSQHGNLFQLKLLMLVLWRAYENKYSTFRLATELSEGEKFDDIVFHYKKSSTSNWKFRLLQAKHKECIEPASKLSGITGFFGSEDDAFSIQKYFKSYLKIKQRCERLSDYSIFSKSEIEDIIIITNADFESQNLRKYFCKGDLEADEILTVETDQEEKFKKAAVYKVKDLSMNSELLKKCLPIFENTSDYYTLIENLVEGIVKGEINRKKDSIIKEYFYPLVNNLLEIQQDAKKFSAKLSWKKDSLFVDALVEEITFVTLFDGKKIKMSADLHNKKLVQNLKEPVSNSINNVKTLEELAKDVAEDIKNERKLNLSLVIKFKKLLLSLDQEFLDVANETFLPIFVYGNTKGNKKLSDEMKRFRRMFITFLLTEEQKQMVKMELEGKELKIFEKHAKKFLPVEEPIIRNVSEFTLQMQKLISDNKETKVIKINKETPSSIKENLQMLSGHLVAEKYGKIRFCSSFLHSDQLPESLKEFKEQFAKLLGGNFKEIYPYEFLMEGFDFKACEDGALQTTLPDLHTLKDVVEFFNKLKFVINYPNRMQINDLLERNIREKFKILDGKAFNSIYVEGMHDWMAKTIGTFLTPKLAHKMFEDILNSLSIWTIDGITKTYFGDISNDFQFWKSEIFVEFLSNEKQVLIITAQNLKLTRTRIVQTFLDLQRADSQQFLKYTRGFGHIFLNLNQIINEDFCSYVLNQIESSMKLNLILIECNAGEENSKLCRCFINLVNTNPTIKIVLIVSDKNLTVSLPNKFKQEYIDMSNFEDLDDKSKLKCLSQKITFQGQQTTFNDILEIDKSGDVICSDILCRMIEKKNVSIGYTPPLSKGYQEIYYVERKIHTKVFVNLRILREPDEIVVVDGHEEFIEKCKQFPEKNVHWFKKEKIKLSVKKSEILIWQKTEGSISNILQYRVKVDDLESVEESDIINDKNDIVIISDLAGMGKSTLLSSLTRKIKSTFTNCWLFRIDLNDCTTALSEELRTNKFNQNDPDWAKDLLEQMLACSPYTKLDTEQEKKLFLHSLSFTKKIILLLDGVDEISPNYTKIIIKLILALRDFKFAKILITTRPNTAKELEKQLDVFAYSLETFSEDNQIKFLTKFWRKNFLENNSQSYNENTESRLKMYAESLIKKVSTMIDDRQRSFTGIPLQLMMLAEIFQNADLGQEYEGCFQFLTSNEIEPKILDKLNLHDLYTMFIKEKYRIYSEEKKKDLRSNLGIEEDNEMLHRMYQEYHRILALHAFFDDDDLRILLDSFEYEAFIEKIDDVIKNIDDGKERRGIIDQAINNKPKFIHRTFIEYFVAEFVVDAILNHKNNKTRAEFITKTIFYDINCGVVRSFINNLFLKKQLSESEFYGHIINSISRVNKYKIIGSLEIACKENNQEIIRFLLGSLKHYESTRTDLYNNMDLSLPKSNSEILMIFYQNKLNLYTTGNNDNNYIHYACRQHSLDTIRLILTQKDTDVNLRDGMGRTPLHRVMRMDTENSLEILKLLLDHGADVNACDTHGLQPLHEAASIGKIKSAKYLLERGADINCVNFNGDTLLHFATKAKQIAFCEWLLNDHKAEVNPKTKDGQTPLHLAVETYQKELTEMLLKQGGKMYPSRKFYCGYFIGFIIKSYPELFAPLTSENYEGYLNIEEMIFDDNVDLIKYLQKAAEKLKNESECSK